MACLNVYALNRIAKILFVQMVQIESYDILNLKHIQNKKTSSKKNEKHKCMVI